MTREDDVPLVALLARTWEQGYWAAMEDEAGGDTPNPYGDPPDILTIADALQPLLARAWDECFQALSDYVEHQETRGTNPGPFPQNPYAKQGQEA